MEVEKLEKKNAGPRLLVESREGSPPPCLKAIYDLKDC